MRLATLFALVATAALVAAAGASAAPLIAEYGATSIPNDAKPTDVVVGPDGNQWYTFSGRDAIARVTPSGEVEEITAGISSGAAPQSIVVGPDNNLWFTEPGHDRIARYSFSTGTVTEFGTGIPSGARPWDIVNESGALWFTENGTGQIGRSSTSGSIAQFSPPVPTGAQLWGLATDDNGYLWFPYTTATGGAVMAMDQDGDEVCTTGPLAARYIAIGADDAAYVGDIATKGIDRIAPGCGPVSLFAASQELDISGLTLGPDNNIWFTDTAVPSVGRLRLGGGTDAVIDVFSEGLYDGSLPTGITAELLTDTLWIGDVGPLSLVGEVSLFGGIAQFGVGSLPDGAEPQQIALGNEWMYFTETGASRVGAISFEPAPPSVVPEGMIVDTGSGLSSGSQPYGVVWDGATGLWITQQDGRIAHSEGTDFLGFSPFTETSVGITPGSEPWDITMAENAPWFTERSGGRYALVDPTLPNFSVQEELQLPAGSQPEGIAESGGFLWIADPAGERIFQQTNVGVDTIPTPGYGPSDLAAGPDGNLWFTAPAENAVGRLTPEGQVAIYQAGISPNAQPTGITAGPGDGALWFTEPGLDQIGRILPPTGSDAPVVSEFGGLGTGSDPTGIAADDEGSVWFTEASGDRIGRALLGPPELEPSATSVSFPDTPLDGSSERTITIENGGDLPLAIAGLSIFPAGDDEFSIPAATDQCSDQVLPVGDSCSVAIVFEPALIGPSGNAWLRAPSNSPFSPTLIPLTGEGIAPALFSVSPSSGAFGDVRVGQTAGPLAFTVTNLGDETFDIGTPAVQGTGAAAFAIGSGPDDCAGQTLSQDESCQVRVSFAPSAAGAVSATLSFDDDAPGGPHALALSGTGVVPGFSVQPSSASFGLVTAGTSSAPLTFTVSNPGTAPLTLGALALTGEDPEDFHLAGDGCSGQTLAPATGTCSFAVRFTPTAVGTRAALVSFGDDAPGGPHVLPVSGTGGQAPLPPPPPPLERPALTRLKLTPVAFTPFRRGGSFAARSGSVLSFRLSQPARVTFSVRRYVPGRGRARGCVPTRAEVPRRQRCRALVAVGRPFSRRGLPAGSTRLTFTGRPNGRALAAGDYRLYATPRNAAGTGARKSVRFEMRERGKRR